jgi:hypothetical protein
MLVLPSRLMCSFGVPEVLFPVGAEDGAVVGDEVGSVEELELVSSGVLEDLAAG